MGKFTTYLFMFSGLMLIFHLFGFITGTANSILLNYLLSPQSMPVIDLSTKGFLVLEGVTAMASLVVIGFYGKNWELAVKAPFTIFAFNLLWDFIKVFQIVYEINKPIALLIFSSIMISFVFVMIEWWTGKD